MTIFRAQQMFELSGSSPSGLKLRNRLTYTCYVFGTNLDMNINIWRPSWLTYMGIFIGTKLTQLCGQIVWLISLWPSLPYLAIFLVNKLCPTLFINKRIIFEPISPFPHFFSNLAISPSMSIFFPCILFLPDMIFGKENGSLLNKNQHPNYEWLNKT